MNFSFTVNASVERTEGKFESRETIEAELVEALDGANPSSIEGENGGTYEVQDWSVDASPGPTDKKKAKAATKDPTPAPVIGRLIYDIVRLEFDQTDDAQEKLADSLVSLLDAFPNVAMQARKTFQVAG